MYSPSDCALRVGIYFTGNHVLLFGMIKNPGPSMYSPSACALREGIYFTGRRVLLFGMF